MSSTSPMPPSSPADDLATPSSPAPAALPPPPAARRSHGQCTLKKHAALPSAPTPCIAHAPSGAATSPIHSTTSSARSPVDIRAAPVDHRQRERPRPLEQPRDPQPLNPPCERLKRKRSLRPLKPPFRPSPKNLRERDHIRLGQPALTTPQTPHLPSRIADPRILSWWTETELRTDSLHQSDAPLGLTWSF